MREQKIILQITFRALVIAAVQQPFQLKILIDIKIYSFHLTFFFVIIIIFLTSSGIEKESSPLTIKHWQNVH